MLVADESVFFFAEVEGDDETIQEGLQAINVAANKIFQSAPPKIVKILPSTAIPVDEEELFEEGDSDDGDNDNAAPSATNSKPKKSSAYKPPNYVNSKGFKLATRRESLI